MKKYIAKLVLFTVVSLTILTLNQAITHAEGVWGLADMLNGDKCIKDKTTEGKPGGPDAGYIITIIEEPISLKNDNSSDTYKLRVCYRNFVSFVDSSERLQSKSALLEQCATAAQAKVDEILKTEKETKEKEKNKAEEDKTHLYKPFFSCQPVQVILSKGGTSLIEGYIGTLYNWAAGIVGIIAVTVIILSGIQISLAGGDTEALNSAKTRIIKSLSGIAVLFLSGLILYTINPTFFTK